MELDLPAVIVFAIICIVGIYIRAGAVVDYAVVLRRNGTIV